MSILGRTRRLLHNADERASYLGVVRQLKKQGLGRALEIPTYTTKAELCTLFRLARELRPECSVLEIGSYLGASSCFLAAGLPEGGRLVCVDSWQNETMPEGVRDTFLEFSKNVEPVAAKISVVQKYSYELEAKDVRPPFDLVFIDGDHSYNAAKRDFLLIEPWVAEQGVVAWHDALFFEGVCRAIGETLATGKWQVLGMENNLLWMRRAVWPNPCPPETP